MKFIENMRINPKIYHAITKTKKGKRKAKVSIIYIKKFTTTK